MASRHTTDSKLYRLADSAGPLLPKSATHKEKTMPRDKLSRRDAEKAYRLIEELREVFGYPSRFSTQYKESSDASATIYIDFPRGRITAGTNSERESYTVRQSEYDDELSVDKGIPKSTQMKVPEDRLQR